MLPRPSSRNFGGIRDRFKRWRLLQSRVCAAVLRTAAQTRDDAEGIDRIWYNLSRKRKWRSLASAIPGGQMGTWLFQRLVGRSDVIIQAEANGVIRVIIHRSDAAL